MQSAVLRQLLADRRAKLSVVLATVLSSGQESLIYRDASRDPAGLDPAIAAAARAAIAADRSTTVESAEGPVFLNVFNPPLRMILVGAVHIAQALAPMAAIAGYDVSIIDPRRAFGSEDRFPGVALSNDWPDEAMSAAKPDLRSAVVTLTHDPKLDDPALAAALRSDAFYIGALGSRKTHATRLARLRELGFGDNEMSRIRGPVGLDIGAVSPAEIAISIMAQVTETLRRRAGE